MAAAGIQYTTNDFDRERFLRIRDIAAEMAAYELDLPPARLKDAFALDLGYQTPKIETRAAIFDDDRVLLVRERNGKWSMPGGWCDEGDDPFQHKKGGVGGIWPERRPLSHCCSGQPAETQPSRQLLRCL